MRQKINLRLSLIALIAIIATAIGTTLIYYNLFQTRIRSDLKQKAELLVETEMFLKAYDAGRLINDSLGHFSSENLRITWIDTDGTVLFDNDTSAVELSNHLNRPEIQEAIQEGQGESSRYSATLHMNTHYYALLLENGTILRVSTMARTFSNVFMTSMPVILGIAVVILLVCISIGHYLTKLLMKPIEEMSDNIDNMNPVSVYGELEPFANKIRSQHEDILAAAKSRQDFTANVTHELKTPITAISGYAELIENGMVSKEDEVRIIKQIRHNADRLSQLVSDIIQLSELDHKEIPRKFEQADLYSIVKESVEDLRSQADKKHITLDLQGEESIFTMDKILIREMTDNLIQNAIRYNKERGSVWVIIEREDGHPILVVKDNGIGIPVDQQDRIFERFYRVDKSRSRQTGGTGLGLAIVKHVADIHSAEIQLKSQLDQGTEIKIIFL